MSLKEDLSGKLAEVFGEEYDESAPYFLEDFLAAVYQLDELRRAALPLDLNQRAFRRAVNEDKYMKPEALKDLKEFMRKQVAPLIKERKEVEAQRDQAASVDQKRCIELTNQMARLHARIRLWGTPFYETVNVEHKQLHVIGSIRGWSRLLTDNQVRLELHKFMVGIILGYRTEFQNLLKLASELKVDNVADLLGKDPRTVSRMTKPKKLKDGSSEPPILQKTRRGYIDAKSLREYLDVPSFI